MLISIAIAAYSFYKLHNIYTTNILIALIICIIADVVIFFNFIGGTIIFALGHIFYIYLLFKLNVSIKLFFLFFLLFTFVIFIIVYRNKKALIKLLKTNNIILALPFILYSLMLITLLSFSYSVAFVNTSVENVLLCLGINFFVISDITLVFNIIYPTNKTKERISLSFYYVGQFLIANAALFSYIFSNTK
ncbi:MAG: hypothetical protein GYA87_08905 [Christensenellaceae bacterium]|nr:hypothetical protein [Christensenellaceae bacterium]